MRGLARRWPLWAALCALGWSATGCEGEHPEAVPIAVERCEETTGRRLLRRLTKREFERNAIDAFALAPSSWSESTLPPDGAAGNGLNNNAEMLQIDRAYAEKLLKNAETIGQLVREEPYLSTRFLRTRRSCGGDR